MRDPPPFIFKPMRKFYLAIILFLSLFVCINSYSDDANDDLKAYLNDRCNKILVKDGESWNTWKDGVKKDYNAELIRLSFKIDFLNQAQDNDYVMLLTNFIITGFIIRDGNIKMRIVSNRYVISLFDRKTRRLLHDEVEIGDTNILIGWSDGVEI